MNFHLEGNKLTIRLEGAERFWAVKRQINIDKGQISDMQWHDTLMVPRSHLGWRFGTAIPGGLFAGRYRAALRNFLYVQKTRGLFGTITMRRVLEIDLRDAEFDKLYLTVNDPDIATKLVAWWHTA